MTTSKSDATLLDGLCDDAPARLTRRALLGTGFAGLWLAGMGGAAAGATTFRRSFYVSNTGSDSNAGTQLKPFLTINGAFRRVTDLGAGDRIVVMPGTYREAVQIRAGGSATANFTLVSQTPLAAKIRAPSGSYSAINIQKNYVTIDGFDVQTGGTGHGIEASYIDGNTAYNGPHHLVIVNNSCHDNPGSGISVAYGDYYRIENNTCARNCATNPHQGSGISVYEPRAVSGTDTMRIFVLRNTCYSNTALTLTNGAQHSDGNGIIMDDFRNTQRPNPAGIYRYRSLVENNVCYFNGGKGVHVYISDNVTVRNNTCYFNNRDPKNPATWRGELSNVMSSNTIWVNNIGYADVSVNRYNSAILHAATGSQISSNVVWKRNLSFNGTAGSASITQSPYNATLTAAPPYNNLLGVNPLFVTAGPGVTSPNLRLQSSSHARNAAISDYGIATIDRDGKPRISGGTPDLGAYELS